jgi:serine/threonine-protein kinase
MSEPRTLGGRYEIGDLLGYGGMAEVRVGRDTRLGRAVAIKVLRSDLARDPSFQSRFRREAQSAAALNHPTIVSVYDTGDENENGTSVPYIVMEYVEGRTLRDVLQTEGPLLPERALEVTGDVCDALEYSHRAGIVHRDIKPGNVMLTPNGDVKVMDFGIARAVAASSTTMTQTASVIGTAQYLSPEQARGATVDARSDIYSTGCLLYELLTGEPPFTGESPVAVAYQHVREDPEPPSGKKLDLSGAVDAIVLKAMAKNPDNRYQSAAEMREDIERWLSGRPVRATPLLAPETMAAAPATTVLTDRPEEPSRRRRVAAYLLLLLAVAIVFVAALFIARALLGGSPPNVHTPKLIGKTQPQAERALKHRGLDEKPKYRYTSTNGKRGKVIGQQPDPGRLIKKGGTVTFTISRGIRMVSVPDVTNQSLSDAEKTLKKHHLKVGDVTHQHSSEAAGKVLSQKPKADSPKVPAKTKVDLTVADGKIKVPDVTGKTQGQAATTLANANFTVNPRQTHQRGEPDGVVIDQNPNGGQYAAKRSSVTITVNHAPKPSPTPSTPSPSPTPSATSSSPAPTTSPPSPPKQGSPPTPQQ